MRCSRRRTRSKGVISNFPNRFISVVLRLLVFPLGRPYVVPSDQLGHDVARLLIEPSATRDRLTSGMYLPKSEADIIGAIEAAVEATLAAEPIEAKIREGVRAGRVAAKTGEDREAAAQAAGVISADELTLVRRAQRLADEIVRVDDFAQDLGASEMQSTVAAQDPAAVVHRAAA